MDKSRIITLIRKCLAKGDASRNNSTAEVETALAMAQKLMAEHNIAMTDVQFNAETQTLKSGIEEFQYSKPVVSKWRRTLPHVVNILCNTDHYWQNRQHLRFVGMKDDIDMALVIYEELMTAIRRIRNASEWESRSAFSYGMVMNLYHRAKKMNAEQSRPSNTMALMIVKDKAIGEFLKTKGLRVMRETRTTYRSSDYENGYAAGESVHLGRKHLAIGYK